MSDHFARAAEARDKLETAKRVEREEQDRQLKLLFEELVGHHSQLREHGTSFEWGRDQGCPTHLCIFLIRHRDDGQINVITYSKDRFVAHGGGRWDDDVDDYVISPRSDVGRSADQVMASIANSLVVHGKLLVTGSYPITRTGFKPLSQMPVEISPRVYFVFAAAIVLLVALLAR